MADKQAAGLDHKLRVLLMAVLLPPLKSASEVCNWALIIGLHLGLSAIDIAGPMLERRRHRLTPSQAAVARVLPPAMLWCGVAGTAAAALALLLGEGGRLRRRARLALAYAALAANHCLCAMLFALVLVADPESPWVRLLLAIISTASIVFFATEDLVGFRSLHKAAAAAEEETAGRPVSTAGN